MSRYVVYVIQETDDDQEALDLYNEVVMATRLRHSIVEIVGRLIDGDPTTREIVMGGDYVA